MTVLTEIRESQPTEAVRFTEKNLIVVEGHHDQRLVAGLLNHLSLTDFQVHSVNGKTKWHGKIVAITQDDSFLDNVERFGVVRDADSDGRAAWQSCVSALTAAQLVPPANPATLGTLNDDRPATSVLIVPGIDSAGAVEELVIPAMNPGRLSCLNNYMKCLDDKGEARSNSGKALMRAFLSGLPDYVHDTRGALDQGHVDFEHVGLQEARDFLSVLAAR